MLVYMKGLFNIAVNVILSYFVAVAVHGCVNEKKIESVTPCVITDTTRYDTDDPAIWINRKNPGKSLIIGTDKNRDGALYAFNLNGKTEKVIRGLEGPNNVDVEYGFPFNREMIDIAVVTERLRQRIRVFRLPGLEPVDKGDLIVFDGNTARSPMGIGIYKRPADNAFFIVVSGKSGPEEGYIGQYRLECHNNCNIGISFVRYFGKYGGGKEIESIAVDDDPGYVYYSDETAGVRKYQADPDVHDADKELAFFATTGFKRDHEGISIYKMPEGKGYILVSDQQANRFWIFPREGVKNSPHCHPVLKIIEVSAHASDGSEVTSYPLPGFPSGLFVAMSNGKTFHYYDWQDIAGKTLSTLQSGNIKDEMFLGGILKYQKEFVPHMYKFRIRGLRY